MMGLCAATLLEYSSLCNSQWTQSDHVLRWHSQSPEEESRFCFSLNIALMHMHHVHQTISDPIYWCVPSDREPTERPALICSHLASNCRLGQSAEFLLSWVRVKSSLKVLYVNLKRYLRLGQENGVVCHEAQQIYDLAVICTVGHNDSNPTYNCVMTTVNYFNYEMIENWKKYWLQLPLTPKDINFTMVLNRKKQWILITKKLEPENGCCFYPLSDFNHYSPVKIAVNWFSLDWLINHLNVSALKREGNVVDQVSKEIEETFHHLFLSKFFFFLLNSESCLI